VLLLVSLGAFTLPATVGAPLLAGLPARECGAAPRAPASASEARYRSFFDTTIVGASEAEVVDGRILRVNAAMCRLTGYTAEELVGRRFSELKPEVALSGRAAELVALLPAPTLMRRSGHVDDTTSDYRHAQ
jgi:PAS domain-containing protein